MPAEDFAFLEEKVRSFDYRAVLVKRWKVAFNAQEWAQIDAFVSGVGAKQLAAMSEIAHDMRGTNRGADFARLRMDTFANSLTARERKVLQEFHQGALGERFMRLLSRAGAETTEIVVAAFNDALKQTNDRRNALNASGWAKEVQAAKEAWAAKGVLDLRDLDVRPRGLLEGRPELPDELLSRDKRVVVVLDFTITSDGKTEDVVVVQSTDSRFDGPCIEAIRRWTFEPGTKDGRPVACRVRAPLAFEPTR